MRFMASSFKLSLLLSSIVFKSSCLENNQISHYKGIHWYFLKHEQLLRYKSSVKSVKSLSS